MSTIIQIFVGNDDNGTNCSKPQFCPATKQDLDTMEQRLMSAISDYVARVEAKFTEIEGGLTGLETAVTGVADDVAFLKETIEQLQNNPGPISPADQALLDAAEARLATLSTRTTAAKDALATVDAATNRPPPPPPPEG